MIDIKTLERRLADTQAREEQLAAHLANAEAELTAALEERRQFLVDGDLSHTESLARAERRATDAERAVAALVDALKLAKERAAEAKHQLDDARDEANRAAEADKVGAFLASIENAKAPLSRVAVEYEAALAAAGSVCPEARGAVNYLRSALNDLSALVTQATSDLKAYRGNLSRGGQIRRAVSMAPAPKVRTPKPEVRRLYFIEHTKWTANGRVYTARQYSTHDLPPALGEKAVKCGLAVDPASDTANKLRQVFGDGSAIPADPARCIDLDRLDPGIDLRRTGAKVVIAEQEKAVKRPQNAAA